MLTGRDFCKPLIHSFPLNVTISSTRTAQTWLCLAGSKKALRTKAPQPSFRNLPLLHYFGSRKVVWLHPLLNAHSDTYRSCRLLFARLNNLPPDLSSFIIPDCLSSLLLNRVQFLNIFLELGKQILVRLS